MFAGLPYITLYWLSGFAENKFEVWDSRKASITLTPDSLSFTVYLAWPLEVAEECRLTIRKKAAGLVLTTDWFPEEEFDLKTFAAEDGAEKILISKFARETFFLHLRPSYE
jgi:hypothetical protein